MLFALRNFASFSFRWLSAPGWTARRMAVVMAFYLVFPLLELMVWSGFLLDFICYRGYRRQRVSAPVFIIGNPRSGTTLLHRLISLDAEHFTTMQMWEILFAPSVSQRRIVMALASMTRKSQGVLGRKLARMEQRWSRAGGMHDISFTQPEEDDYLMLHIWSALTIGLSAGLIPEALPYTYFDSAIPAAVRKRVMYFYKACIKRHLYAHALYRGGKTQTYLAKNPALCPKLNSVMEVFPDAKFIYLVRSPFEMIPSYVSMMRHSWRVIGIPDQEEELRTYIIEMARHWYSYPLERLNASQTDHVVIHYDDLTSDPEATVHRIYEKLHLRMGAAFGSELRKESAKARRYESRHGYDLDGTGLSPKRLATEFKTVFDAFGFETKRPTVSQAEPFCRR